MSFDDDFVREIGEDEDFEGDSGSFDGGDVFDGFDNPFLEDEDVEDEVVGIGDVIRVSVPGRSGVRSGVRSFGDGDVDSGSVVNDDGSVVGGGVDKVVGDSLLSELLSDEDEDFEVVGGVSFNEGNVSGSVSNDGDGVVEGFVNDGGVSGGGVDSGVSLDNSKDHVSGGARDGGSSSGGFRVSFGAGDSGLNNNNNNNGGSVSAGVSNDGDYVSGSVSNSNDGGGVDPLLSELLFDEDEDSEGGSGSEFGGSASGDSVVGAFGVVGVGSEDRVRLDSLRDGSSGSKSSGSVVGREVVGGLGSSVSEVVVGGDGRVVGVSSGGRRGGSVGVGSRSSHVLGDGRLSGAELRFFNNLQMSRKGALEDPELVGLFRGRVGGIESAAERRARSVAFSQAIDGRDALRRGSKVRFGVRDREVVEFLARFRYVKASHLANIFCQARGTMVNRLGKLRRQGLVIDKKIYGSESIWFLTSAGMLLSGFDLPLVRDGSLSLSMFPHQFTVNFVASHLQGGGWNVLQLDDFPAFNRVGYRGEPLRGERLCSELEIQSSFGKAKNFQKGNVFKSELLGAIDVAFAQWERAGGVEFGESPEFLFGNEYMWALLPSKNLHLTYHVPDLVVKRDRGADGSPGSIAVEVEINNKPSKNYENTLLAYREDRRLFSKVIWVCKGVGPANRLKSIAQDIGLWQEGRIEIVPISTPSGIFRERDLWMI